MIKSGRTHVSHLSCVKCTREFDPFTPEILYTCPDCGIEGTLDVIYDQGAVAKSISRAVLASRSRTDIWRYGEMLPIDAGSALPSLVVGPTPLYEPSGLRTALGTPGIYIKDEGRNPTASLKDRASAVGLAKAMETGAPVIATASTGNAASSMAGFAAAQGVESLIFVPERAPAAKVAQLLVFGSKVLLVEGTYDDAWELCRQACERWGWFNRSCAINPYLVEGKKTVIIEALEQLCWRPPATVWVAVGDGCTVGGVYKGLSDCMEAGLIDRMPRIIGVQAAGCNPFVKQWLPSPVGEVKGSGYTSESFEGTLADSIAVGTPRNLLKGIRAVEKSGGSFMDVSDAEIMAAVLFLGRTAGVFAEPAGAAAMAGYKKSVENGLTDPDEEALVLVTGNGLKDVEAALKVAGEPLRVPPDIEKLAAAAKLPPATT